MIQITLAADTAIDLARVVFDLNMQLNPGEATDGQGAAAEPAPARTRRARVGAGARTGSAGALPAADEGSAEGDTGSGALGQPEEASAQGGPPATEDHMEGDAGAGDGGDAGGAAVGDAAAQDVPTAEAIGELARRLAQEVNFSAVQATFARFEIRKFKDLPSEKYADFAADAQGQLDKAA